MKYEDSPHTLYQKETSFQTRPTKSKILNKMLPNLRNLPTTNWHARYPKSVTSECALKPIFRQNWHSAVGRVKFEAWGLCILIPVGELLAWSAQEEPSSCPNAKCQLAKARPAQLVPRCESRANINTITWGGGWKVYQ